MIILGIESSCDDTSIAIVECNDDFFVVLSEKTASQIEIHKKYGGVVPEIAGRMHAENIIPVVESVIEDWRLKNGKMDALPDVISVTTGPGLITGLLVGAEVGKTLSYLWDIPIIGINHIEGHIHSVLVQSSRQEKSPISNLQLPALCLIVSGGHTELVFMKNFGEYALLGKTRDDAAGEAFDKVGKLLGFEYPGGPKISKLAVEGNANAIAFPRPMIHDDSYDFSFAGLKTSALYWLRDNSLDTKNNPKNLYIQKSAKSLETYKTSNPLSAKYSSNQDKDRLITLADFCASFEQAIVDVLVEKTRRATKEYNPKTIILGGGVSANPKLRESIKKAFGDKVLVPERPYTMDNGAMIAVATYHRAKKKEFVDWRDVVVNPNWKVYE